jgi:hypothetical protein
MSNQVTAIDFDSQELIGKIHFKYPILQLDIRQSYLIVTFIGKIIVCDVFTLKHLFKVETGDELAVFDVVVTSDPDLKRDNIIIAHHDEEKKLIAISKCKA